MNNQTFGYCDANVIYSKTIIIKIPTTYICSHRHRTYILNQLFSTHFHKQQSSDINQNTCFHSWLIV